MRLLEDPETGARCLVADEEVQFYADWVELGEDACAALQLQIAKDAKRATINMLRDRKQVEPAPTPIGIVDADEKSKTKINGLVSMAQLAKAAQKPFDVQFTAADNQRHPLNADGMISVGLAVGMHVMACHDRAAALKEAVDACETVEAVEALDIDGGW